MKIVKQTKKEKSKIKENNKFFNAFVSDAISRLEKGETILCFYITQVEEIKSAMKINVIYDNKNKWWIVSKKETKNERKKRNIKR